MKRKPDEFSSQMPPPPAPTPVAIMEVLPD